MENTQENELLFKNTSRMNEEEIFSFQSFVLKKTIILSAIAIVLVCAAIGVGLLFVNTFLGIAIMVCGVLGGAFIMPYMITDGIKKQNQQMFDNKKCLNNFEFYNDHIKITSEVTTKDSNEYVESANEVLLYLDVYQVAVYKTYIFIYINKRQSYILNQKGMTKGVVADLLDFLKSKNIKIKDKSNLAEPIKK